ncbi:MAG: hypothetical protein SGJ27_30795 [Candidatus Melainabacteria bacterium]|nr:hypothetical protein [Candidatus Melainabacteria bacterium]
MLWSTPDAIPKLDAPTDEIERLPTAKVERTTSTADDTGLSDVTDAEEMNRLVDDLELIPTTDFNFIDTDAALVRSTTKKKQGRDFLNRATKLTIKSWDKLHLWFSVFSWVEKNMKQAKLLFDLGETEQARKIFHSIYKTLESSGNMDIEAYSPCLFRLGCCYLASDTPSLAQNYFLLSLQNSRAESAAKPALYLAVARAEAGDEAGALRLLTEHLSKDSDIKNAVKSELHYHLLNRKLLFEVLAKFCQQSLDNDNVELAADGIYATWSVLRSRLKTDSIDPSDVDGQLDTILNMLAVLQNTSKVNDTYEDIATYLAGSKVSNRGAIAYLCTSLGDHIDLSQEEPASVKTAIITVAHSGLKSESELELLKTSALKASTPAHVSSILMQIGKQLIEVNERDTASDIMRIAFDITAENSLPVTNEMLTAIETLDSQVNCLKSILQNRNTFRHLIVQLGNSDRLTIMSSISSLLLAEGRIEQLALMLTIVHYSCPDAVFKRLCREVMLPERMNDVEPIIEGSVELLADLLKASVERSGTLIA